MSWCVCIDATADNGDRFSAASPLERCAEVSGAPRLSRRMFVILSPDAQSRQGVSSFPFNSSTNVLPNVRRDVENVPRCRHLNTVRARSLAVLAPLNLMSRFASEQAASYY